MTGTPEILGPEENYEVLTRLVDHFEQHVADPRPLDASAEDLENARRVSKGTLGLRLIPTKIVAKRKMSQNKPPEIVQAVLDELEGDGFFSNAPLAREMRLAHDQR